MTPTKHPHLAFVGEVTATVVRVGASLVLICGTVGLVVWVCRWMMTVIRGVCL